MKNTTVRAMLCCLGLIPAIAGADTRLTLSACQLAAFADAVVLVRIRQIGDWSTQRLPGRSENTELTAVEADVVEVLSGSAEVGPIHMFFEGLVRPDGTGNSDGPVDVVSSRPAVVFLLSKGGLWVVAAQGFFRPDSVSGRHKNQWLYREGRDISWIRQEVQRHARRDMRQCPLEGQDVH